MVYKEILKISANLENSLNRWLNTTPTDENDYRNNYLGEDEAHFMTVFFKNGYSMDIMCCGKPYVGDSMGGNAFTKAVLFDTNYNKVCHTEPRQSYVGEWTLEANGDTYIVIVTNSILILSEMDINTGKTTAIDNLANALLLSGEFLVIAQHTCTSCGTNAFAEIRGTTELRKCMDEAENDRAFEKTCLRLDEDDNLVSEVSGGNAKDVYIYRMLRNNLTEKERKTLEEYVEPLYTQYHEDACYHKTVDELMEVCGYFTQPLGYDILKLLGNAN